MFGVYVRWAESRPTNRITSSCQPRREKPPIVVVFQTFEELQVDLHLRSFLLFSSIKLSRVINERGGAIYDVPSGYRSKYSGNT